MTIVGLTSGEEFLRNAARRFFEDYYESPQMHLNEELHRELAWTPALRFTLHECINVFVEPSETGPYPRILEMKNSEVRNFPEPIAIYAVCPDNMLSTSDQQSNMKSLQSHGFGLITVAQDGRATQLFHASPLIQVIPRAEFKGEIKGLPKKIRQRASEAFEDYCNKPVNGVKTVSELLEGLVTQAGNEAVKKNYLTKTELGNGSADTLDALHDVGQFKNVRAEIGGVRSYIKEYRNLSHHWPKNKNKAHKKYADCRHAFLDAIKQIARFRAAMKKVALSGNLSVV